VTDQTAQGSLDEVVTGVPARGPTRSASCATAATGGWSASSTRW